jgi:hypothetical protein
MIPSETIDQLIAGLTDWRRETLTAVRKAILAADPQIVEEWKWMGSPVWYRDGIIAVANAHLIHAAIDYNLSKSKKKAPARSGLQTDSPAARFSKSNDRHKTDRILSGKEDCGPTRCTALSDRQKKLCAPGGIDG